MVDPRFPEPGYLGSQAAFTQRFVDADRALAATRRGPPSSAGWSGRFVLRRLKTDPTIIQDLPEKHEMKVFCTLTPEQATLYQAVVRDMMARDRRQRAASSGAGWCWRR